ncbi:TonB-linked outer membrane protein, SusC/RagA family [Sphingobacterium nematocida]|uniref:TonB-linked outer membrane protein, SusC/RagA family n=1 Tax=Sphingobacterium nematocida TaxID=1513896 RepID=A0A1T5FGT6_9SPHI|nr:SusC/RagA family TonB-linked outer membrane protein [Sphingobacterium nematocida]SKB95327.1 TonB-linked outer membrane protein, SusC/RagA family [Sphingobacterium nematocida]
MRRKCTFLLLLLASVSLPLSAQFITIKNKSLTLKEAFEEIKKQTGYTVFLKADVFNSDAKVLVDVEKMDLKPFLEKILKDKNIDYTVNNKTIALSKKADNVGAAQNFSVQQNSVTVKVLDGSKQPIEGATIMIVKSRILRKTDKDGTFVVRDIAVGDELEIRFMGKKTTRVKYNNEQSLAITLKDEINEIEEFVVTGYQKIDKRRNTSEITTLSVPDLLVPGMTSLDQLLEGNVPDLMFMQNSGELGATPRLRIRGTSTLLGNREPLWVLDGFVMQDPVNVSNDDLNNPDYVNIIGNAISGINPQDIDRIDILKDASATALYGTRAANGVIVITTKRGVVGKPSVSFRQGTKMSQRPRYTDKSIYLMNSAERVAFGKDLVDLHYAFPANMAMVGYEGAFYRYQTGKTSIGEFQQEVDQYANANTDWFKALTQDTYSFDQTLSLSGGSEDTRYFTSFGYNRENGVLKNTYSNRFTGRININSSFFNDKIQLNVALSGSEAKRTNQQQAIGTMDYAYNTTRALPLYDQEGDPFFYDVLMYNHNRAFNQFQFNILNEIDNSSVNINSQNLNSILSVRYKVNNSLDLDLSGNYSTSGSGQESWWGEKTHYIAKYKNGEWWEKPQEGEYGYSEIPYGGILNANNSSAGSYTFRIQANYRKQFGEDDKHSIHFNGGYETYENRTSSIGTESRGYLKDRGKQFVDNLDLELFPRYRDWINKNHTNLNENLTRTVSGYGVLSYSYKTYFSLNANSRFDISNKFGSRSNERLLPVWSVSGNSNFKQILFKDIDFINTFSTRASFGIQGNMLDDQSPNFIMRLGTINPMFNEYVSYSARIPNPNLRWEQTRQWNFGADASIYEGRINVGVSLYGKRTNDAFSTVSVAAENGTETYVMNSGKIKNSGYSVSLALFPIKKKDFSWYMSTYYGGNFNRVQSDNATVYTAASYLGGHALVNGESVGTFYSYKFLGLNPADGSPLMYDFEDRQHLLQGKNLEETVKMVMVNSGSREPNFSGSLTNRLNYKRLSVSAMLSYSLGGKARLFGLYKPIINGVKAENNVRKEMVDRWVVPGDETKTNIPAIISPSSPNFVVYNYHYSTMSDILGNSFRYADNLWSMYDQSDIRVVSANYLKLTSLIMRYNLENKTLKRTPFRSASLGFGAMNLFTWSAKELRGQAPTQAGFDKPNLSLRPQYTFELSVSF